jgi:peroxin-2
VQNEHAHELGEDEDEDAMPSYPITTPYITSCGHVYCYFCLSEKMISAAKDSADGGGGDEGSMWECLRCGEGVRTCERLVGVDHSESGSVSDLEVDGQSDRISNIGDMDAEYSAD